MLLKNLPHFLYFTAQFGTIDSSMATEYVKIDRQRKQKGSGPERASTKRIGDLANIQAGYQFRERVEPDPSGNVGVLQIKDIPDRRRLTPETIDRIVFDKPYSTYLVTRGDVLFLSRGHKQFAVAIEHDLRDTIASGYFYILRIGPARIRPAYLAWYFNQQTMQDQFKQLAKGTHMPFVSQAEFRELEIPIPPRAVQDQIVALAALADREQAILTELAAKRAQIVQTLSLSAAERVHSAVRR